MISTNITKPKQRRKYRVDLPETFSRAKQAGIVLAITQLKEIQRIQHNVRSSRRLEHLERRIRELEASGKESEDVSQTIERIDSDLVFK